MAAESESMQRVLRIVAVLLGGVAVVLLALAYLLRSPAGREAGAAPAAPAAAIPGEALGLRMSPRLGAAGPAGLRPGVGQAPARFSPAPLAAATAALLAFAGAFWSGRALRRRRAAPAQPQTRTEAPPQAVAAASEAEARTAAAEAQQLAAEAALARLAAEVEERDLELQRLRQEIADWQDAWRLAKPRLDGQQAAIEQLEAELAGARSALAGMRRYVSELQRERGGAPADSRFAEDVDAWIARFMHPARRA